GDDKQFFVVDLELGAGVLRVEHLLALADVHRLALAVVANAARANGQDGAFLRLFLGRIRQDDAALGHFLTRRGLDDHAVAERLELGCSSSRQSGVPPGTLIFWAQPTRENSTALVLG